MTSFSYKYRRWQFYGTDSSLKVGEQKSVSKQILLILERDSVYDHLRANFKKVYLKLLLNYLQYKIHKRRLLSWIHPIAMIRVTVTF